jgi:nitroreductase
VGIAEALSLPKDYMVIALLAVGFPAEQPKQRPRKPIETFIVPHDLQ